MHSAGKLYSLLDIFMGALDDAHMTDAPDIRTRRGGVALWRQIADVLADEIERGMHRPGTALPGEMALGERFAVNRHTVRQALRALAEGGLVRSERGRGTIVREGRLDYPIGRRTRFSEIVSAQSREPAARLLGSEVVPAPADIAGQLAARPGEPLVRLETLSLADGQPLSLASHWFVEARCPGIAAAFEAAGSVTAALARCGIPDYARRETRVTARASSPEEAGLLGLRTGSPILISEALNVAPDGVPTHYTRARFAADRVQLVIAAGS